MRLVVQRVTSASVKVEEEITGAINEGYMVLVGVTHEDTEEDVHYLAEKLAHLRIFEDENGKMNHSLLDVKEACCLYLNLLFMVIREKADGRTL